MTTGELSPVEAGLKLGLAFLLGLPLGWEFEHRSRSVGLRTYPLVSLCVCGFLLAVRRAGGGPDEQADIFFGVLAGIGFVGSGAILKSPRSAHGMGAAVSLWVTGAIGAGVAYGTPLIAVALSLMSPLAVWAASRLRRRGP